MKNCTGIFCPMQYGKVDPATCQAADSCSHATPPKTKADLLRTMTDEELAAKIEELCQYAFMQISVYAKPMGKAEWLKWLKQEVET